MKYKPRPKTKGNCKGCGREFVRVGGKVFCCQKCWSRHSFGEDTETYLCTGTIGALHELRVCVDLMSKGWYVFRAMSPASPADLVAVKGDKIIRIQVRKAKKYKESGKVLYNNTGLDKAEYDVLALSFIDGSIQYTPNIE